MKSTATDSPPVETLAYATKPARDERPYGRADCAAFVFCATLAGANVSLGAVAFVARDDRVHAALSVAGWAFFAAYIALYVAGQCLFWRRRPDGDLPPISAFALACVAALSMVTFLVNLALPFL